MNRRALLLAAALAVGLGGAVVHAATTGGPRDWVEVEAGDGYLSIVDDVFPAADRDVAADYLLAANCDNTPLTFENCPLHPGRYLDFNPDAPELQAPATTTTIAATTTTAAPTTTTTVPATTTTTVAPTTTTTTPPTTTEPPVPGLIPAYQPDASCPNYDVIPIGQASAAANFEPLGPVWCYTLNDPPVEGTAFDVGNTWIDDFTVGCPIVAPAGCTSMMTLADGEMGYNVFDRSGANPPLQAQHWINQNHWMTDARGGFSGGSSLSPDRSFVFEDDENGDPVFVLEGDVAAGIPEYNEVPGTGVGRGTWVELTISTAAEPACTAEQEALGACVENDTTIADPLYAYGQFGGDWAVGCRLNPQRTAVCAVMAPNPAYVPGDGQCSENVGDGRILEISWFQQCGTVHTGGAQFGPAAAFWRECEPDGPDRFCRDRFRMEVRPDGLRLYVNGALYFEDSGWPAAHQIPATVIADQWHAYQSNWQNRLAADATVRYHWDHYAVNPVDGPQPGEHFPT